MLIANDFRRGRHCVFEMHVHLVFVTKYRRNVLTKIALDNLHVIFEKVCNDFEATLEEFNGEEDHVHLLINYPPKVALSRLVNSLKGVSARLLRQQIPALADRYWQGILWSPSYFAASCGGAPLSIIKRYIENQRAPAQTSRSRMGALTPA